MRDGRRGWAGLGLGLLLLAACSGDIGGARPDGSTGPDGLAAGDGGGGRDRRVTADRGGGDDGGGQDLAPGSGGPGPGPDGAPPTDTPLPSDTPLPTDGGPPPVDGGPGPDGTVQPGASPQLGGCAVFPPDDDWNLDVSEVTPDDTWTTRLQTFVGSGVNLHPDFGGTDFGIPINIVPQDQTPLGITFFESPDESDPSPYPFPGSATAQIEGGTPTACSGDCHVLVLQQGSCKLYEGYACQFSGGWQCANGAVWDLTRLSYGQRTVGWTSADAAGLSITAGLLRLDEVMAGEVKHAIRFTTRCTINSFVRPATHRAVPRGCDPADPDAPPMGLRVRLSSGFDGSGFSAATQVVLTAMKTHGMIIADNGSNFFFQGERNAAWPDTLIDELKQVPASAFEAVAVGPLMP
jgi:hypothetical protein